MKNRDKMMMVSVIGAGAIGTAIGNLIKQENTINYLDVVEEKIKYSSHLKIKSFDSALAHSDIVFICVPSKHVRKILERFNEFKTGLIVICIAKGIEEDTLKTMDLLMEEVLDTGIKSGLLYGPMLASELKEGQPGFAHLAIKDHESFFIVKSLFPEQLCLTYSSKPYSIAIAGILKNVYALALGIADGLNYKNNYKGWLVSQSMKEMKLILKRLGQLDDEVEFSFLSDFITTGYSNDSRNHLAGTIMGRNEERIESEGTRTIPAMQKLLEAEVKELLLFNALAEIIVKGKNAKDIFEKLIAECS